MSRLIALIVGLCVLSGCTITMFESSPEAAATSILPQLSAERTAAVPEGARVEIDRRFNDSETRAITWGVVLKASPEGLALANCTVQGTSIHGTPIINKVPYVSRLFTNTGIGRQEVPVLWVPASEINEVTVLQPPPQDYVPSSIEISSTNTTPVGVDFDASATP